MYGGHANGGGHGQYPNYAAAAAAAQQQQHHYGQIPGQQQQPGGGQQAHYPQQYGQVPHHPPPYGPPPNMMTAAHQQQAQQQQQQMAMAMAAQQQQAQAMAMAQAQQQMHYNAQQQAFAAGYNAQLQQQMYTAQQQMQAAAAQKGTTPGTANGANTTPPNGTTSGPNAQTPSTTSGTKMYGTAQPFVPMSQQKGGNNASSPMAISNPADQTPTATPQKLFQQQQFPLKLDSEEAKIDQIAKAMSQKTSSSADSVLKPHPGPAPHNNGSGTESTIPSANGTKGQALPKTVSKEGQPGIAVSLEEIAFFMEDMERTVWWLIKAGKVKQQELKNLEESKKKATTPSDLSSLAAQLQAKTFSTQADSPDSILLKGSEELPKDEELAKTCDWWSVMESIEKNVLTHIETHEHQLRSKMFIVVQPTREQKELLDVLTLLRFNCGGRIIIFDIPNHEMNHKALWHCLHENLINQVPCFGVQADLVEGGLTQEKYFMQCLSIVPYIKIPAGQQGNSHDKIKLYSVFFPDKKRKHWSFVSGEVKAGGQHTNIAMAAHEIWSETVGVFYQWTWNRCFTKTKPFLYANHERDGTKYPIRPYLFVEATPEFYEYTCHELKEAIPNPLESTVTVNYVRYDEPKEDTRMIHTQGHYFKNHDDGAWLDLDWDSGRLSSRKMGEKSHIRRDVELLFKQQPRKLWSSLFGPLLEKSEAECNAVLGKDLPTDPPFVVQMQGIDKAATDEDILEFYQDGAPHCQILSVTQMQEPRHSARVEFVDQPSLRVALRKHNEYLKRRKVKIELWHDGMGSGLPVAKQSSVTGGSSGGKDAVVPMKGRSQVEYSGPLPKSPPYKCVCRNLDRTVTDNDLGYFFWDRECEPKVISMEACGKHTGIVEFGTVELLKSALKWNGVVFKGREISVSLYDPSDENSHANGEEGQGGNKSSSGGNPRTSHKSSMSSPTEHDSETREGGDSGEKKFGRRSGFLGRGGDGDGKDRGGKNKGNKYGDRDRDGYYPKLPGSTYGRDKNPRKGSGEKDSTDRDRDMDKVWERGVNRAGDINRDNSSSNPRKGNNRDRENGGMSANNSRNRDRGDDDKIAIKQNFKDTKADHDDNWRRG
ncbi:unnamed protein product [Amoebophrya sp. A120]|nr:unnamed protein product [Amoebophrya sp. A120]|eukprot:GSA120T00013771001.1